MQTILQNWCLGTRVEKYVDGIRCPFVITPRTQGLLTLALGIVSAMMTFPLGRLKNHEHTIFVCHNTSTIHTPHLNLAHACATHFGGSRVLTVSSQVMAMDTAMAASITTAIADPVKLRRNLAAQVCRFTFFCYSYQISDCSPCQAATQLLPSILSPQFSSLNQ